MATAKVNGDRNNDAISKNQPRENVRNRHDNVTGTKLNVQTRDAVKRNATEDENSTEGGSRQHYNCSN